MEEKSGQPPRRLRSAPTLAELQAVAATLARERQHYHALFEFAPDGYLVTGRTGTIREANRAAVRLLRAAGATLRGQPLARFVVAAERARFAAHCRRLRGAGAARQGAWEGWLQPRAGAPFPAALSASAECAPDAPGTGIRWLLRALPRPPYRPARPRLLPICTACKQVRTAEGAWQEVEVYLREHDQAACSHSLCPRCLERLYPEMAAGRPRPMPRALR
jgi:PAS domain S-box-containing protein